LIEFLFFKFLKLFCKIVSKVVSKISIICFGLLEHPVTVEFLLGQLFDAPVRACFHAFRFSMRKEKVKKKPLIREPELLIP